MALGLRYQQPCAQIFHRPRFETGLQGENLLAGIQDNGSQKFALDERALTRATSGEGESTVASIEPEAILELIEEVESLVKTKELGDKKKGKSLQISVRDLRVAINGGAADFDSARWSRLGETQQNEVYRRLTGMRQDLVGNTDEEVSNKSILWLTLFGFIFAATLVSLVR